MNLKNIILNEKEQVTKESIQLNFKNVYKPAKLNLMFKNTYICSKTVRKG